MAKGYRAKVDVSFPKVIAKLGENDEAVEGVNYPAGSLIRHDSLQKHVKDRIESGELDWALDPVEDDEFDSEIGVQEHGESSTGVFIAEHEAEAHALRMGGHIVVPKDQALEAASAGQQHAADYQRAVREHGLDRRPAQEHYAGAESEEGRVPDHFLHGAETRTGLPHNRGPQQAESDESDTEGDRESDSEATVAARPRPTPSGGPTADAQMTSDAQAEANREGQE
jgi:hypothetical protein